MKHQHASYTSATGSLCTANVKAAKSTSEKSIGNVVSTLKFPCKGLFSHVSRADLQSHKCLLNRKFKVSGDKYTLRWGCYQFHIISKERISRCITPLQDIVHETQGQTGSVALCVHPKAGNCINASNQLELLIRHCAI